MDEGMIYPLKEKLPRRVESCRLVGWLGETQH